LDYLTVRTFTEQMIGLNLGRDMGYHDVRLDFPQPLQANTVTIPLLIQDNYIPDPFQLNIRQ
jgi:hypothetical protein